MQRGKRIFSWVMILIGALISLPVLAAAPDNWQMNMFKGVTPVSHDIYYLHMISMGVCLLIAIGVYGVLIYSIVKHRKSKGHKAASFHDNLKVEIIWTIIPFFILVALAIPATKVLIRMEDSSESDITIKVTGYQWKWQYEYLDQGINFFSLISTPLDKRRYDSKKSAWYLLDVDKPLVLPTQRKVRFLLTSNDVIHSWWVPELAVKKDAMPGFIHEAWTRIEKPGTYRGQCAELCGFYHGFMPIVVKALPPKEFDAWVAKQDKVGAPVKDQPDMTMPQLMGLGKKVYDANCVACHGAKGKGRPPIFPALKGSSVAVGHPISRHINLILNGVSGTAMQAYAQALNDKEVAALTTYERNAWGNNTGELVQPNFVAKVRAGEKVDEKNQASSKKQSVKKSVKKKAGDNA